MFTVSIILIAARIYVNYFGAFEIANEMNLILIEY